MVLQQNMGEYFPGRAPIRQWKTPEGNYYRSAFEAFLAYPGGAGAPYVLPTWDVGEVIELLLFCNDTPIVCKMTQFFGQCDEPFVLNSCDFQEEVPLGGILSASTLMVADQLATDYEVEQQVTGLTATNGVRVEGYFATCTMPERGIEMTNVNVECTTKLLCISKGAVTDGPPHFVSDHTANPITYQPIILRESNYTQAIRNAGDIIQVTAALFYEVCGLYCLHVEA